MESKATAKFVRVSPRKTRLVARNVKGMPVEAAMNLLRFTPNKPAGVIRQRGTQRQHGRGCSGR